MKHPFYKFLKQQIAGKSGEIVQFQKLLSFGLLTICVFALLSFGNLAAQARYNGVWHAGDSDNKIWVNAPWQSFEDKRAELSAQGYRLVDIEIKIAAGERRYSGLWHRGGGGEKLWIDGDIGSFQTRWDEWTAQGLNIVDLEIKHGRNGLRFTGVWREGNLVQKMVYDADWEAFKRAKNQYAGQGLALVDIETYVENRQRKYAGIFQTSTEDAIIMNDIDPGSYQSLTDGLLSNGYALVDMEPYLSKGAARILCLFHKQNARQRLLTNTPWSGFLKTWRSMLQDGFRLDDLEYAPAVRGRRIAETPRRSKKDRTGASLPPRKSTPVDDTDDFIIEPLDRGAAQTKPSPRPSRDDPGIGSSPTPEPSGDFFQTPPAKKAPENNTAEAPPGPAEYGKASFYADKFQGRRTASGEPYDKDKLTAAHRTHPFGTKLRVTNLANKKSVIVRVNDRGPHIKSRVVDLSREAARRIDGIRMGIFDVKVEVVK